MTDVGYVAAGYVISAAALAAYTWRILSRGRRVSSRVPEDRRRWM